MLIQEGLARIEFEELDEVFFNPRGKLSRSFGVLGIRALSRTLGEELVVADAFTGVGTRSIRYLLETGDAIAGVHANDSSAPALEFAIRNARLNGVIEWMKFHCLEARRFFWRSVEANRFYHFIDIDVFGTPMQFIPFAVNALKRQGAIYVTSTDTAPLCGINRKAAFRNYGAVTENVEFCHEAGARIVIAAVLSASARQAYVARPLFTLFDGYAFRILMMMERGRKSFPHKEIGFIFRCPSTGEVKAVKQHRFGTVDMECPSELQAIGPMWLGDLHDPEFLRLMLESLSENWFDERDRHKLKRLLKTMQMEIDMPPFFHDLSVLADRIGISTPRKMDMVNALRRAGFRAGVTHFSGTGIKTDADHITLARIARELVT